MKQYHKVKQIEISDGLLTEWLTTGHSIPALTVKAGLPPDAKIVRVLDSQLYMGRFYIFFESDEFEPIDSGTAPPYLDLILERAEP